MNVSLFTAPTVHPFGLLRSYDNASEKESTLAYILIECIKAGAFVSVPTIHDHTDMVKDGLLIAEDGKRYRLTTKAIGLLYSVYGKEA